MVTFYLNNKKFLQNCEVGVGDFREERSRSWNNLSDSNSSYSI